MPLYLNDISVFFFFFMSLNLIFLINSVKMKLQYEPLPKIDSYFNLFCSSMYYNLICLISL